MKSYESPNAEIQMCSIVLNLHLFLSVPICLELRLRYESRLSTIILSILNINSRDCAFNFPKILWIPICLEPRLCYESRLSTIILSILNINSHDGAF